MMNQNWPRWIFASIHKHFLAERQGLTLFVEGLNHVEDQSDYLELRVDGPYFRELTKDNFKIELEINVLIASSRTESDFHKIHRDCGIVVTAFNKTIKIFKLGNGVEDDQSLLGCLQMVRSGDAREALRTSHFGQIQSNTPVMRASVEGHYFMNLHG